MILLLDNYKQSLPIMRSLQHRNIPFLLGSSQPHDPITFSQYSNEVWKHPEIAETESFLAALLNLLEQKPEIDAIFPIGELGLKFLAEHEQRLPENIYKIMPSKDNILLCLDKKRCSDFINDLQIPIPNSTGIKTYSELRETAEKIGFPLILKPNFTVDAFRTEKAIILQTKDDLERVTQEWDQSHPVLLESYIHGERISLNLTVQEGNIITYLENQAQHTQELDGTGYTVRTVSKLPTAILREYAEKIMAEMHYTGIINMQFLYCTLKQRYYFMEINPRMPATTAFIYRLGIDVAAYALHVHGYRKDCECKPKTKQVEGILCNWFYGDLVSYSKHLIRGKLTIMGAIFSGLDLFKYIILSDVDQLWSFADPKPALVSFIRPFMIRFKK